MKKLLLITTALLFTLICFSQKVNSKHDKFLKETRLTTSNISIIQKMGFGMALSYRGIRETYFFNVRGYGKLDILGHNSSIILLLEDESTMQMKTKGIQGAGTNTYNFEFHISKDQIKTLSNKNIKSIRIYMADHYRDFEFKNKKNISKFKKLSVMFLEEINKNQNNTK